MDYSRIARHSHPVRPIFFLCTLLLCALPAYNAQSQERTTGTVVAWGNNSYGQLRLPNPNNQFTAISAGDTFNLNLKLDGSIVALGTNKYGQCTVPTPNTGFTAVAAGWGHALGLKDDGSVIAWGRNDDGQCEVPEPNEDFISIAAGSRHSLALKSDGSILAWGDNSTSQSLPPTSVVGFQAIAAGTSYSLALQNDGSLLAWGDNTYGQLNLPTTNTGFTAIAAGSAHGLALKEDGSIVAWGQDLYKQCQVPAPNSGFIAIAAGWRHSLGLKSDGSIVAWGNTSYNQCRVPTPNTAFIALSAGQYHSVAIQRKSSLKVSILPPHAVTAGARWHLTAENPKTWHSNGQTISLPENTYTLEYKDGVYGWDRPTTQSVTVLQDLLTSVTAVYTPHIWTLSTTDTLNGSVSISPNRTKLPHESLVTLKAQPESGYSFTHWTGDIPAGSASVNPLTFVMDANKVVVAHFAKKTYTVSAQAENGRVMAMPDYAVYPDGTTVTLYTIPNPGTRFDNWRGDIPAGNESASSITLTIKGDTSVTAVFKQMQGQIVGWGNNSQNQLAVPAPNTSFTAVTAGTNHSLGLKSNGTVVAWGNNQYGQCNPPTSNTGITAIASGSLHNLCLNADGVIQAWGRNTYQQCEVPSPNTGFVAIAAGTYHSLGLKADGSVAAWGYNRYFQCDVPEPNANFVAIAAGANHSLGLKADGSIVAWGLNTSKQCAIPTPNSGFLSIASGSVFSMGLKEDGSVVVWGNNSYGQYKIPSPNTGFRAIHAGATYVLGIKTDGSMVTWGNNTANQCTLPVSNSDFIGVAGATNHTLAIKREGLLQITAAPQQAVSAGIQWQLTDEADGGWHTLDETVRFTAGVHKILFKTAPGWGTHTQQISIQPDQLNSIPVEFLKAWTLTTQADQGRIILSPNHTVLDIPNQVNYVDGSTVTLYASPNPGYQFAGWTGDIPAGKESENPLVFTIQTDTVLTAEFTQNPGAVRAWGLNTYQQCSVPQPNIGYVAVAGGTNHSLGLKADGSVVAWGYNRYTQCNVPEPNTNSVAIAAGVSHSLRLNSDGSITAWGSNSAGQCKIPLPNSDFIAIATGANHSLGLKANGSIAAWGSGQVPYASIPNPNRDFIAIAAGTGHSLGLKSDGSIVAWGTNNQGQCNIPSPNTDFVAIAAGGNFSMGLKLDGSIVAWGYNGYRQCNIPTPNTGFVAIVAGTNHAMAQRGDGSIVTWGDKRSGQTTVPGANSGYRNIAAGANYSLAIQDPINLVQVTLTPADAVTAGAQWRLAHEADGVWHNSGDMIESQTTSCTVEFKDLADWNTPADQILDLVLDALTTTTAEYTPLAWSLSVSAQGDGSVALDPEATEFIPGATVTLTAIPNSGSQFQGWTGDVPAGQEMANPLIIVMDANKSLVANFARIQYPLTVLAVNGSVLKTPNLPLYDQGSQVMLEAIPDPEYDFVGWSGDVPAGHETDNPLTITLDAPKTLTALFTLKQFSLTLQAENGSVTPVPDQPLYPYGTTVTLEAAPDEGFRFVGWSGDVTGTTHPLEVVMDSNKTISANFELRQYALVVESENGSVIKTPDAPTYSHGTTVTLEAVPDYGYRFSGWSGDVPNGAAHTNPIEVVLESTRTLTAHFTLQQYPLTVLAEHGSVSAQPNQPLYAHGALVTLQATPVEGYHFTGWTGDSVSTDNPLQITMNSTQTLTAQFEINTYPLTLEAENGAVTALPDLPLYPHGSLVTLEATPAPGYHFTGWSGDATGTVNPLQITMNSAMSITAHFSINEYVLTVNATNGSVTKVPDAPFYTYGAQVILTALPETGYTFTGWTGDVPSGQETANPLEITMDAAKSLTAQFEKTQYPLTVQAENGTVEIVPNQSLYAYGTQVILHATPASGFHFIGWSGDATDATNPLEVTMDSSKTLVANFARNEYTLTIHAQDGAVTKSPDQAFYSHGDVVTLTATPSEGYEFESWSGDATGTTNPLILVMDSTRTLTANFIALETEPEAWYAIRYSRCDFKENTLEPGSLLFQGASLLSSVNIQLLKGPSNSPDIPGKVAYRKLSTVPLVRIEGDMRTFQSSVSIEKLEATGYVMSLTGQNASIALIEAGSFERIKLSACSNSMPEDSTTPEYASTAIYSTGEKFAKSGKLEANNTKVYIQLCGVILTDFSINQPVICVKVSSRKYLANLQTGGQQKRLSLGGIGPVARVAAEAIGQTAEQMPQDSILQAPSIHSIQTCGASVTVDQILADLSTVKTAGCLFTLDSQIAIQANLRAREIHSNESIDQLDARSLKHDNTYLGGFIGYPSEPDKMTAVAPNMGSIYGGKGVSGIFIAGIKKDGTPDCNGAIRKFATIGKIGQFWGEAYCKTLPSFSPAQGTEFTVYTKKP